LYKSLISPFNSVTNEIDLKYKSIVSRLQSCMTETYNND